ATSGTVGSVAAAPRPVIDAGAMVDAGFNDAGSSDAGSADAGDADAGTGDELPLDAGTADAGVDAGAATFDAGSYGGSSDSGTVPTWDVMQEKWICRTNCNNSLYDQKMIAGIQVCIPC